jgi:hypothetical protein
MIIIQKIIPTSSSSRVQQPATDNYFPLTPPTPNNGLPITYRFYSKFKTMPYNKITFEVFATFSKAIEKLVFRLANSQVRANKNVNNILIQITTSL